MSDLIGFDKPKKKEKPYTEVIQQLVLVADCLHCEKEQQVPLLDRPLPGDEVTMVCNNCKNHSIFEWE